MTPEEQHSEDARVTAEAQTALDMLSEPEPPAILMDFGLYDSPEEADAAGDGIIVCPHCNHEIWL